MLEATTFLAHQTFSDSMYSRDRHDAAAVKNAVNLYRRVSLRAWAGRVLDRFAGRSSRLMNLADVTETGRVRDRRYAGLQTVALHQVRGSENRTATAPLARVPAPAGCAPSSAGLGPAAINCGRSARPSASPSAIAEAESRRIFTSSRYQPSRVAAPSEPKAQRSTAGPE